MPTQTRTDRSLGVQIFHALSDPVRLDVIELLGPGERCVCELTDALDVAQSRLSFHLKVLKEAGLVTDRREGRWSYYALVRERFDEASALIAELRPHGRYRSLPTAPCCD